MWTHLSTVGALIHRFAVAGSVSPRPGRIDLRLDAMVDPILRSAALASGTTEAELRQALRTGELQRIAPGAYLSRTVLETLDATELHRARIRAVRCALGSRAAISHVSAAIVHGFDVWDADLSRVHLTHNRPTGARRTTHLHSHAALLAVDDVEIVDGVPVTSAARTVVDLARTLPPEQAVVIGDSAMRMHPALNLRAALDAAGSRAGIAAARRIAGLLDGRSESPGESLSRLRMREAGTRPPELQHELRTPAGLFVARVDFFWEDPGIVGEFDGMGKYGSGAPGVAADVVRREKLREDAIRELGLEVVRWTWAELFRFDVVLERLARAAERARR